MKKVINGKLYNTETAKEIAYDEAGCGSNDFNYYCETLYITKSKNFFLAGEGHAMSRWAQSCGTSSWGWGSNIEPLTKEEALAWCERANVSAEIISEHFTIIDA